MLNCVLFIELNYPIYDSLAKYKWIIIANLLKGIFSRPILTIHDDNTK